MGRVDTLGFAVTDVAFARNSFNTAEYYKMFPVSPNAVKTLEGAKRLIFDRLSRNFYGMKYFVIPRFLQKVSDEKAELLWNEFLQKCDVNNSTLSTQFQPLIQNEKVIGAILDNEALTLDTRQYSPFAIDLTIPEVNPREEGLKPCTASVASCLAMHSKG